MDSVEALTDRIRENVSHIARGCRAGTSHNPAIYETAITEDTAMLRQGWRNLEEQHAALQREYEDLERRLADCSQALANDDGVFV